MSEHTSMENVNINGKIKWKNDTSFKEHRTEPTKAEILFNNDKITEIDIPQGIDEINTTIPLKELLKDQSTVTGDLKIQIGNDNRILDNITIADSTIKFTIDKNEWTEGLITLILTHKVGDKPISEDNVKIDVLNDELTIIDTLTGKTDTQGEYTVQLLYDDYVDLFNGETVVFQAYVNGNQFPNNRKVVTVREHIATELVVATNNNTEVNLIDLDVGQGSYQVNWGDGTEWELVSGADIHKYEKAGVYTLKVRSKDSTTPITEIYIENWKELQSVKLAPTIYRSVNIYNCNNLDSIQMADNLIQTSESSLNLKNNPKLKYVKLAEGWTDLTAHCLDNCPLLDYLILPSSLTMFGMQFTTGNGSNNMVTEFNWTEENTIINYEPSWELCRDNRQISVPSNLHDTYIAHNYPVGCTYKQVYVSFGNEQLIMGNDSSKDGKLYGSVKLVDNTGQKITEDLTVEASLCLDKGNTTYEMPLHIKDNEGTFLITRDDFEQNLVKGFNRIYVKGVFLDVQYVLSDKGNEFEFEIVDWYMGANIITDSYQIKPYKETDASLYPITVSKGSVDNTPAILADFNHEQEASAYTGHIIGFKNKIPQFTHWKLEAYIYNHTPQGTTKAYNNTIDIVAPDNPNNCRDASNDLLLGTWSSAKVYMDTNDRHQVRPRLLGDCWYKFEIEQNLGIDESSYITYTITQMDEKTGSPRGTVLQQLVAKNADDMTFNDIPDTLKWVLTGQKSQNYIQNISIRVQDDALPVKRIHLDSEIKSEYAEGESIIIKGHVDNDMVDKDKIRIKYMEPIVPTWTGDNFEATLTANANDTTIEISTDIDETNKEYIPSIRKTITVKKASIIFNINKGEDIYTIDDNETVNIPASINTKYTGSVSLVDESGTVYSTINCNDEDNVTFTVNKNGIKSATVFAKVDSTEVSSSNRVSVNVGVNLDNVTVNYGS